MNEPLPKHQIRIHSLDPTLADVRIVFDNLPGDVEVRGRIVGPRCPGINTVEVAYPLRPLSAEIYQVVITEPNFWEPEHPYRYEGSLELLKDGAVIGQVTVSIGLRSPKKGQNS